MSPKGSLEWLKKKRLGAIKTNQIELILRVNLVLWLDPINFTAFLKEELVIFFSSDFFCCPNSSGTIWKGVCNWLASVYFDLQLRPKGLAKLGVVKLLDFLSQISCVYRFFKDSLFLDTTFPVFFFWLQIKPLEII